MAKRTSFSSLKKYRVKVFLAPALKAFESVCELLVPIIVKLIIDYLDEAESVPENTQLLQVFYGCLLMFGLAIAGFGITMITQYLSAKVASDYAYDLKKELYEQLDSLSTRQIEEFGSSKTLTLINNDSFSLQTGVNMFMRLFVRSPFILIGSVVASFLVNVYAGLVVLGALLLSSIVVVLVMVLTPKRYAAIQTELDHISTLGEDSLSGARVIRAFNKQEDEQARFAEASASYREKAMRLQRINALLNPLTFAFISLGIILVLYMVGYQGDNTSFGVGDAVAIMSYFTQSLTALIAFSHLVTSITKAASSKKRLDEFLALEPDIVDGPLTAEAPREVGPVFELRNASLSYGGEDLALQGLDFHLDKGEKVGIIGGTGSGKSSLINLLERFLDPHDGEALYNGKPLTDYSLSSLREQMAFVSQKPQLYKGSIRSNLLLGNPEASEEDIELALKDSLAAEFVANFDDGLEHPVTEAGSNLSGGQKQRLLVARALLSNRPILILDDSTSALDYKSDLLLRQNVARRGLTTILVSQRATSIKDCDRIYVLDKGRLAAVGKHDELLSSCPIYQEIYESQVAVK